MQLIKLNILVSFLFLFLPSKAQNKYALIIANANYGNYYNGTQWEDLSSGKDVPLIKKALLKQGFSEENIHVEYNVTKKEFITTFYKNLIDKVKTGDIAFFHFSGHGQEITDINGDEEDGYDESLVAIDAPMDNSVVKNYTGDKHVIDDELEDMLDLLRKKAGPTGSVLVTLDACQSGTATRGISSGSTKNVRGTFLTILLHKPEKKMGAPLIKKKKFLDTDADPSKANLFVISASSQNQLNYEYTNAGCGSLSYAFNQVFPSITKGSTYRTLYLGIKSCMSQMPVSNTPQAEGDQSGTVLGNKIIGGAVFFSIGNVDQTTRKIYINAGEVDGIFKGTTLLFYSSKTERLSAVTDPELVYSGIVKSVNLSQSVVEIPATFDLKKFVNLHVFIQPGYLTAATTKIRITNNETRFRIDSILKAYETGRSIIITSEDFDLDITSHVSGGDVKYDIIDFSRLKLDSMITLDSLFYRLIEYGHAKLLRNLGSGEASSIDFKLMKQRYSREEMREGKFDLINYPESQKKNEVYLFKNEEILSPVITNNNDSSEESNNNFIYFLLFEITPHNNIGCMYPNKSTSIADCQLGSKSSNWMKDNPEVKPPVRWRIVPPYGRYQLRLLVSSVPFDETVIKNLYLSEGIRAEANKYLQLSGTRGGMENEVTNDQLLQSIKNMGVKDIFYDLGQ